MAYISVAEAAERWQLSERRVQKFARDGRIPGAKKFSGSWAIPEDAARPQDPRKSDGAAPQKPQAVLLPMPLMNTAFAPGHAAETVAAISDPDLRVIACAELAYFSGQAETAAAIAAPYLDSDEPALRLSACFICSYANLTLGDIQRARAALARVQQSQVAFATAPELSAAAVFIVTAASVLLHLPLPDALPDLSAAFKYLPPGLRQFAVYVQAHQKYLAADYAGSIAVVENALNFERAVYPIPAIYLHLVAVMDAMSLKDPDRAEAHLLAAWELAQPDDLIEAFGEHHGLLGGMLEVVIKPKWPEDFKRIINITYRFSWGWRRVHNPDTGHDVADNLSTTEFAICMLAARDWNDGEIAEHLNLSVHTVKSHLSNAYSKLGIKGRRALKDHMLL